MAWRLEVVHHTTYVYESEVHASFNELRMTPSTDEHQILIQHRTSVGPTAPIFTYRDYWGTTVQSFDLQTPHMSLSVIVESLVDSYATSIPQESAAWDDLASAQILDDYCEYLPLTQLIDAVPHGYDMRAYESPRDAVEGLAVLIRHQVEYSPGATHVFTQRASHGRVAGACARTTRTSWCQFFVPPESQRAACRGISTREAARSVRPSLVNLTPGSRRGWVTGTRSTPRTVVMSASNTSSWHAAATTTT